MLHDPGRGAPLMKVRFRNPYYNRKDDELIVAPEGIYTGQYLYAGKKAALAVGNIVPIGSCPEGTVVCNVERAPGDRGKIAKASGDYCIVVSHTEDAGVTKIRMPSGGKKTISSDCRAMVRVPGVCDVAPQPSRREFGGVALHGGCSVVAASTRAVAIAAPY